MEVHGDCHISINQSNFVDYLGWDKNAIHTGVLNAQHFGGLHIVETDDALTEQALLRWHRNRLG